MAKKKKFNNPYVGIDSSKYSMLYVENGDYSVVINCSNPVLQYAADHEAYYNFHNIFSTIFKYLGAGYVIQKQDIITKKRYTSEEDNDYLSGHYKAHFENREYNHITTNLVITRTVKRSSFFQFDKRQFEAFERNIAKIEELLKSKGLNPKVLNEDELKLYVKRVLAFNFNQTIFSFDNIKGGDDSLLIGAQPVKSMPLIDIDEINLPAVAKPYRNVNELGFDFPVDIMSFLHEVPNFDSILYNQVVFIPEQQAELVKLDKKKARHMSMPDPANDVSVEDIDSLLEDVAKNSRMLVYSHFNIMVKSEAENLDTAANYIETSLFNSGIILSKAGYNQLELFRTALPGNARELKDYDKFLTTSDAAICFFFKERLMTDEQSPFKIFFADRQGIPVAIDTSDLPMETGRINNRNKFVLGPSGSGKSFFMNHLVRQYALYNMDVVLVDTGHSYSGLCSYYGGKYITYEEDRPITMNPFRITLDEYNEEKREFIKSLIGLIWKGADSTLSQVEDTILSATVEAYYADYFRRDETPDYLCFNSFYEFSLERIKEIMTTEQVLFDVHEYAFILKRFYKGGQFEVILNENMDASLFDEPFIVFEIDAIKEHKVLFPITTIIIMDVFLQKMRHKKNRKALIIEEAWKAIASPMMASYILYLYKTVRKFWGEATVVTQELDDILGNPIVKDSILANSDTVCLLDQTKFKDNYESVAKLLSLSDIEQRKIFTINNLDNKFGRGRFKEVYVKRGATGEVYGVEVSIHEYLTFTTERKEKDAVKVYLERYNGNYKVALDQFVDDLKSSSLSLSEFVNHTNSNALVA